MSETTVPDALEASKASTRPVLMTITVGDESFDVIRKPSTLLIAELARTGSGDPEAIGVISEFFEVTLGKETYRNFRQAVNYLDTDDDGTDLLMTLMGEVIEGTTGRPSK